MIGIDIVSTDRIKKLMEKYPKSFLEKYLNEDEISLIKTPNNAAGFYAAKEAASKAIGTGIGAQCSFHDILLGKSKLGAPKIKFSKKVKKAFKIKKAYVSITHDGGFAAAIVHIKKKKDK